MLLRRGVVRRNLFCGPEFSFQGLYILEDYVAAIDRQYSFGLKPGGIARNQLAYRADLRRQLLVADWQSNFQATGGASTFGTSQTQEEDPMPATFDRLSTAELAGKTSPQDHESIFHTSCTSRTETWP